MFQQLRQYKKLVLGFSGGADSTALALKLLSANIPFEAVHFHHHLRKESADLDAKFCKKFCKKNDIPFELIDIPVKKLKQKREGIESAARRLRMDYWNRHYAYPQTAVLLAHHKDDILENLFIRTMRGSSSSGLSGLRRKKVIDGVTYLRPLLNLTKEDILEFLKENKADWCEDESNKENIFTRNIIRNQIIPTFQKIAPVEGIYRTVENIKTDALYIEEQAEKWLSENELNKESFLSLHDALKPRVLRNYIQQTCNRDFIAGHDAVKRILDEIKKDHKEDALIPLGNGLEISLATTGEFYVQPEPYSFKWDWKKKKCINLPYGILKIVDKETTCSEKFKLADLKSKLEIRNWQHGDRMIPFGRKNPVKVKDLFADRKAPHLHRRQLPLIISGKDIIWIPETRRAEFGRCEESDESIIIAYERF